MTIIVYGSTTGNTEGAAQKIAAALGDAKVLSITDLKADDLQAAERIILGTSTWGFGDLQDDWEENISILKEADLSGKTTALFGLGDQEGYPDSFVNGMKTLKDTLVSQGAEIVGDWPTDGYNFEESSAVENNRFVGLALDEDNQSQLTDERISAWIQTL